MNRMRKHLQRFLPQLLGLFLLVSCGQEDSPAGQQPVETGNVPRIASVSLPGNVATRSIITATENLPDDGISVNPDKLSRVGLYAVCEDGTEYKPSHGSNTGVYQKTAAGWVNPSSTDAASLILPNTYTVNIYAWHPYTLAPYYANGNFYISNVSVRSSDNFTAAQQTDCLYATGCLENGTAASVNTANNPKLHFKMKHAMAKLEFTVKKDASNTENLLLKEFVLKTSDAKGFRVGEGTNRRMNLATGAFSNLLPTSTLTYTTSPPEEVTTTGVTVTALVVPVEELQLISFELTMDVGSDTRIYRTKTLTDAATWLHGKLYKYTLKIDKMSADIVGDKEVEVYDWLEEKSEIPIQ